MAEFPELTPKQKMKYEMDKKMRKKNSDGRKSSGELVETPISHFVADDNHSYITYNCIRSKATRSGKKCTSFQLSLDSLDIYNAQIMINQDKEPIRINEGPSENECRPTNFYLYSNSTNDAYSLRKKKDKEIELLAVSMYQLNSLDEPKSVIVVYTFESSTQKVQLISQKPVLMEDGKWSLDFCERYTIPSKSNCILLEFKTEKEIMAIRQVDDNEIEIDVLETVPPLYVFAVALSFWTSRI